MIDLEAALIDLAEHLDCSVEPNLDAALRARISAPVPVVRRHSRARVLLAIAAVIVLVSAAVVSIAPARHAIADWLGIGAVDIRTSDHPLPTGSSARTVPGAPNSAPTDPDVARQLATARRAVHFAITTPGDAAADALLGVEVDPRVRGGLVVLRYRRFTLIEIATDPNQPPMIGKLLDPGERAQSVTVNGDPGRWITGAHEIGYLDRSGNFETDTVRRSGPVLLWEHNAVTYRIEGLDRLTDAQAIAHSIR